MLFRSARLMSLRSVAGLLRLASISCESLSRPTIIFIFADHYFASADPFGNIHKVLADNFKIAIIKSCKRGGNSIQIYVYKMVPC
jgi:hypothetical protein